MSQTWTVPRYGFAAGCSEADFHGGERAGVVGADGVDGGLARVAVEAAGDVDGECLGCCGRALIQSMAASNGGRGSPGRRCRAGRRRAKSALASSVDGRSRAEDGPSR